MKKFILIDQSIKDSGGHHLEYALRVLRAAKQNGYRTVLATNKIFDNYESPEIDVIDTAFTHGFWENQACEKQMPIANKKKLIDILREKKEDFIYDLIFGQIGFSYRLYTEGKTNQEIIRKYRQSGEDQRISVVAMVVSNTVFKFKNALTMIKQQASPVIRRTRGLLRYIIRMAKVIGAFLLAPFILIFCVIRWNEISGRTHKFSELFGSECCDLFERVSASEGDVVFIPTLSYIELLGITHCDRKGRYDGIHWHLLFRRNLFIGRESEYIKQIGAVDVERGALHEFKTRFKNGKVSFYTDTVPLTEQYDMLAAYSFMTLPIPHDKALKKSNKNKGPLLISYIGDARDEKGFQYLPGLVMDIRANDLGKDDAVFRFQSNFNVPLGEPSSRIAKAELSLMADIGVELVEGPFESEYYADFVNNSDVLLVPYNENNYYARSSGVFAEALAAGVPVVYPMKSWMGRELLRENIRYWRMLESATPGNAWNNLIANKIANAYMSVNQFSPNTIIFIRYALNSIEPGTYLRACIYKIIPGSDENKHESTRLNEKKKLIASALVDLREKEGVVFLQIEGNGDYQISLEPESGDKRSSPTFNLAMYFSSVEYRACESGVTFPRQSVGFGYDSIEDISDGLLEIISNYPAYEEQSLRFSLEWNRFHSAATLVQALSGPGV